MLTFEKQISKTEVLKVISQKGNHMGNISYKTANQEWGFNLFDGNYLCVQECIDIAEKLKELNNATV